MPGYVLANPDTGDLYVSIEIYNKHPRYYRSILESPLEATNMRDEPFVTANDNYEVMETTEWLKEFFPNKMTFQGLGEFPAFNFNNYPRKMVDGVSVRDPDYLPYIAIYDVEHDRIGDQLDPFS